MHVVFHLFSMEKYMSERGINILTLYGKEIEAEMFRALRVSARSYPSLDFEPSPSQLVPINNCLKNCFGESFSKLMINYCFTA